MASDTQRPVLAIHVHLVNGTDQPEFLMSPSEFSARLLGDDWRPPILVWQLTVRDASGAELTLGIDPRDTGPEFEVRPIGYDEPDSTDPDLVSPSQSWAFDSAMARIETLQAMIPGIHPKLRDAVASKLSGLLALASGGTR